MLISYIKERIKKLHYKRLFLFGAYLSVITLAFISSFVDIFTHNLTDGIINFISALVALISYIYVCRTKQYYSLSAIILFWIVAITEFAYIFIHQVDFNIIFSILIPILAFFTMKKREIIIILIIYYILLFLLLVYFYNSTSNNYILHNITYIHSFIIAQIYIIVFGIFYYLSIEEFIHRLEDANKTQKLLLKEVHHRVKNNLNLIASIIGLQEHKCKKDNLKYILEQNRHRIESIAILHEVLYKNNLLESADTKPYLTSLIKRILESSNIKNINLITNIHNIRLSMNSMLQLGIILNELLTNTIKHNKNSNIKIVVEFKKVGKIYHFIYCDNSINVDLTKLKSGFGYNLITLSASIFNATINLTNDNNLCFDIALNSLEDFIEL